MSLQAFKDNMAIELYGMSLTEAWEKSVCVRCKTYMPDLEPLAPIDIKEWKISGQCPKCFAKSVGM